MDYEQIREIAYQAAGACSGVFLRMHPSDIMPSEAIAEAVERVLADHGITEGAPQR